MGVFDWAAAAANKAVSGVQTAGQFGTGVAKGVWDFGKDTVSGFKDLGVAGYQLSTDAAYREQAWQGAQALASQVKTGAAYAIDNPQGALDAVRNAGANAYASLQAERAQAAAEGRLAEFDGHLLGRVGSELVPFGMLAKAGKLGELGKVGKAAELLTDGKALKQVEAIGDTAVDAQTQARRAVDATKAVPDAKPCATQLCLPSAPDNRGVKAGRNGADRPTGSNAETVKQGEPVSMATGEELLELTDFTWDGPVPLRWARLYRSGQSGVDLQLGHGWLTPIDEWLDVAAGSVSFHDREGRRVELPLPAPGERSLNIRAQLRLHREAEHWRLTQHGVPDRLFEPLTAGRCRLQAWRNASGQRIDLVRDAAGDVQALSASWGRALVIERRGRHIAAIGPGQALGDGYAAAALPFIRYEVDDNADLVATADRLGDGERYAYQNHVIVQRTLPGGFSFYFDWDRCTPTGRCLRSVGDKGIHDTRFEWLANGISRATDSRGGVAEYMHDAEATLLWHITPEGRTTRYGHDDNGLLHSVTDPAGHVTRHERDDEGRVTAVIDALGHTHRLRYDDNGHAVSLIDPLGHAWARSFDADGRLVRTSNPLGATTRIVYNELGLPAKLVDALGRTRTLLWDAEARLVGDVGFDGVRRRFHHDADDRVTAVVVQGERSTRYGRDAAGRVTSVQTADDAQVALAYDAAGRLTRFTDAAGHVTQYRYADGMPQPSERIDATGQTLRYHYDSERNLVGLTNAAGDLYQLRYDGDERLVEEIGFDGREQRFRYGPSGVLDAHAQLIEGGESGEPLWRVTRFERDPVGRLLRSVFPDGSTAEFSHDALGHVVSAGNAHSQVSFSFDAVGALIQEQQSAGTVTHAFDLLGRRTATRTPDGQSFGYRYGERGHVEQVDWNGELLTRHRHDAFGQEEARQQGELVSQYDHDPMGRLLRHEAQGRDGSPGVVLGRVYRNDAAGRLAAIDDFRLGETRYVYDLADRLLEVQGLVPERFAHDPAGNLLGAAADGGGRVEGGRLQVMGDRRFSYDAAGNRTEQRRGTGGRLVTRYEYDAAHRLVGVASPEGVSRYRYDALGRRIAKATPAGETRFVYDGARLLTELRDDGSCSYVHEPGGFRPLARIDRYGTSDRGTALYYHLDHLGTPREMTDAQGRIVWSARLRAHGALALADVSEVDNALRFQGQYFDEESGLHYNLNRYYDPDTGSFIHQDPIGLAGGENLYRYAPNPVNWVDPLGLACKAGAPPGPSSIWTATKSKSPVENALGHWKKHASEFPELANAKQYVEAAAGFASSPPVGVLVKPRGLDTIMYHEASNTFLVKDAQGTPRTMFRPDPFEHGFATNLDYFNAQ